MKNLATMSVSEKQQLASEIVQQLWGKGKRKVREMMAIVNLASEDEDCMQAVEMLIQNKDGRPDGLYSGMTFMATPN